METLQEARYIRSFHQSMTELKRRGDSTRMTYFAGRNQYKARQDQVI
jgi:hypothetical protein